MTSRWPLLIGCALALAATRAPAHDTWFAPLTSAAPSKGLAFALGTGNRYPVQESAVGIEQLVSSGCRGTDGGVAAMTRLRDTSTALWLASRARHDRPHSCWAQLQPFEIELPPAKVAIYLDEIHAPASVRETWAAMQQRGLPWRERFTKHARIEHTPGGRWVPGAAVPMAMDVLMTPSRADDGATDAALAVYRPIGLQLLREGRPLAGLAVELRHERASLGIWRRTGDDGRVEFMPPLPGRWVLRGTELRPAPGQPGHWESGFVTLAFDVPAPAASAPVAAAARLAAQAAPPSRAQPDSNRQQLEVEYALDHPGQRQQRDRE